MRRIVAAVVVAALPGCGAQTVDPLCGEAVSVAGYIAGFSGGLANLDDQALGSLEGSSIEVLSVVLAARDAGDETTAAARSLAEKVADFVATMNSHDWDVTAAQADDVAVARADRLGSTEAFAEANAVEAHVITECGLVVPSLPSQGSAETLPGPAVSSPHDTEPPSGPQNDGSEARAVGRMVATMFSLVLDDTAAECLGAALGSVEDATQAVSSPEQYEEQFRTAFAGCGIDAEVP